MTKAGTFVDGNKRWPDDAEYQYGDHVTTKRVPLFAGPVIGWYRPSNGKLGYAVEADAIPGLVHVYPATGLVAAFPDHVGRNAIGLA